MSQADLNIDNISRSIFRAEVNSSLQALASNSSGTTEPTTTYPYQYWADTTTGLLKQRNGANDAWISKGLLADIFFGASGGSYTGLVNLNDGDDIASASTVDLTAANGNTVRITGTTAITAFTMNAGQQMYLIADGALPLTYNATTMNINGGASYTCTAGDRLIVFKDQDNIIHVNVIKQDGTALVSSASNFSNNYISGLTMSTAGSSTTLTVAAGQAADSTNSVLMAIASSIAKTTSSWAVGTGNGGLDTGTIANSTWYHWYLIRRPDTGVVDVIFSTSASAPTLPANYTQYRRIGAGYTNGSAQWTKFLQFGDHFYWATPSISASNATVPASRTNVTTLTPLGVRSVGIYNLFLSNANNVNLRLYGIDDDDLTVTADNTTLTSRVDSTRVSTTKNVITDTSSQVSWRGDASISGSYLQTLGYIDFRGKN